MIYTTRLGDRPLQAHVNYQCPCGCVAGLTYDRATGAEHLGQCCCGRLLWVGDDAESVVTTSSAADRQYEVELDTVRLPWGDTQKAALAVPLDALAGEQSKRDAGRTPTKVVDPVCRMMFDPTEAAATSTYKGKTFYFCAVTCKEKFDADPGRFVQTESPLSRMRRLIRR